jgi:hypothetical protein
MGPQEHAESPSLLQFRVPCFAVAGVGEFEDSVLSPIVDNDDFPCKGASNEKAILHNGQEDQRKHKV